MPREVMQFPSRYAKRREGDLSWYERYRLVQVNGGGAAIERFGLDAMGVETWTHVEPTETVVWDLLSALVQAEVTFPKADGSPVTFAVRAHDTPEHTEDTCTDGNS